jgi:hypothetical protein
VVRQLLQARLVRASVLVDLAEYDAVQSPTSWPACMR